MFEILSNIIICAILLIGIYKAELSPNIALFIVFVIVVICLSNLFFLISFRKDMEMGIRNFVKLYGLPVSSEKLFLLYRSKNNSKIMTKLNSQAVLYEYDGFFVVEIYGYAKKIFIDNIITTDLPPKTDLGIRTGKYSFYFKRTQPMIELMHKFN